MGVKKVSNGGRWVNICSILTNYNECANPDGHMTPAHSSVSHSIDFVIVGRVYMSL